MADSSQGLKTPKESITVKTVNQILDALPDALTSGFKHRKNKSSGFTFGSKAPTSSPTEGLAFHYHGKYGGPNYTGGEWGGADFSVKPEDQLDSSFREHDYHYHQGNERYGDLKHVADVVNNFDSYGLKEKVKGALSAVGFAAKSLVSQNKPKNKALFGAEDLYGDDVIKIKTARSVVKPDLTSQGVEPNPGPSINEAVADLFTGINHNHPHKAHFSIPAKSASLLPKKDLTKQGIEPNPGPPKPVIAKRKKMVAKPKSRTMPSVPRSRSSAAPAAVGYQSPALYCKTKEVNHGGCKAIQLTFRVFSTLIGGSSTQGFPAFSGSGSYGTTASSQWVLPVDVDGFPGTALGTPMIPNNSPIYNMSYSFDRFLFTALKIDYIPAVPTSVGGQFALGYSQDANIGSSVTPFTIANVLQCECSYSTPLWMPCTWDFTNLVRSFEEPRYANSTGTSGLSNRMNGQGSIMISGASETGTGGIFGSIYVSGSVLLFDFGSFNPNAIRMREALTLARAYMKHMSEIKESSDETKDDEHVIVTTKDLGVVDGAQVTDVDIKTLARSPTFDALAKIMQSIKGNPAL